MSFHSDAKAPPSAVNRLVHGDPAAAAHRDLAHSPAQAGPSGTSGFRQRDPNALQGSDDDFGRFMQAGPSSWSRSSPGGLALQDSSAFPGGDPLFLRQPAPASPSPIPSAGSQRDVQDGSDIQSLLSSTSLTDAVHGDWHAEAVASQSAPWRVSHDSSLPLDPAASAGPSLKGKGKGKAKSPTPGDVSPTSLSLLSSLSSLDLSDQAYLRTLLAQSPERAVQDYFDRRTYADDVWGVPNGPTSVPKAVDEIMSKAKGGDGAGAREKAVRRLAMVARHLGGAEGAGAVQAGRGAGAALGAAAAGDGQVGDTGRSEGMSWADEYPLVAQHSPRGAAARSLAHAPDHAALGFASATGQTLLHTQPVTTHMVSRAASSPCPLSSYGIP